jgi:hypothetical protein
MMTDCIPTSWTGYPRERLGVTGPPLTITSVFAGLLDFK